MNIIISGLISGSMLALLAIGFSLIFGVARIVNIAHTAFYMVAGYCIYYLSIRLGLNLILPCCSLLSPSPSWVCWLTNF